MSGTVLLVILCSLAAFAAAIFYTMKVMSVSGGWYR